MSNTPPSRPLQRSISSPPLPLQALRNPSPPSQKPLIRSASPPPSKPLSTSPPAAGCSAVKPLKIYCAESGSQVLVPPQPVGLPL